MTQIIYNGEGIQVAFGKVADFGSVQDGQSIKLFLKVVDPENPNAYIKAELADKVRERFSNNIDLMKNKPVALIGTMEDNIFKVKDFIKYNKAITLDNYKDERERPLCVVVGKASGNYKEGAFSNGNEYVRGNIGTYKRIKDKYENYNWGISETNTNNFEGLKEMFQKGKNILAVGYIGYEATDFNYKILNALAYIPFGGEKEPDGVEISPDELPF